MKREDFIKAIGAVGSAFLLGSLAGADGRLAFQLRLIPIYDNYIRGTEYTKHELLVEDLKVGDGIELIREPDNMYDQFAIGVFRANKRLGYIASYENRILANLLDGGVKLKAVLSEVNELSAERYAKNIYGIQVKTELMVPITNGIELIEKGRADNAIDVYRTRTI